MKDKISTSFTYKSTYLWNKCYKSSKDNSVDFTTPINSFKARLKKELFNVQKLYDDDTWLTPNHDITEFTF